MAYRVSAEKRCGDGLARDLARIEALDEWLGKCQNCAALRLVLTTERPPRTRQRGTLWQHAA
jgi:hypothetical protein